MRTLKRLTKLLWSRAAVINVSVLLLIFRLNICENNVDRDQAVLIVTCSVFSRYIGVPYLLEIFKWMSVRTV